jgi:hypothetical protein
MPIPRQDNLGQNVQSVSVIAPLPLSFVESPIGRAAGLHSMLCARSSRTRAPTLRSSAHRPLPVLTPVAATVSETTKSHHACSAERADQVTYGGDQARVAVCKYGKRSHKVSPCWGILHRRMHRTLSGAASAFGEECPLDRAAAPCFGFKHESN